MTFQRTSTGYTFYCDDCGATLHPAPERRTSAPLDFNDSWERAKGLGWRTSEILSKRPGPGNGFKYQCEKCA